MAETIVINTDGACTGNPGPGGFAAIIQHPTHGELTVSGGDPSTTNNKMELSAVIEALRIVNSVSETAHSPIRVRTDSQYVTNAFNKNWLTNWQKRGWRKADGQPVLNRQLWEQLLDETKGRRITWTWVKGHNGDPMNERCDRLAVEQAAVAPHQSGYWCNAGIPISRTHCGLPSPIERHSQPDSINAVISSPPRITRASDPQEHDTLSFDFTDWQGNPGTAIMVNGFDPQNHGVPETDARCRLTGFQEDEHFLLVKTPELLEAAPQEAKPDPQPMTVLEAIAAALEECDDYQSFRRQALHLLSQATAP